MLYNCDRVSQSDFLIIYVVKGISNLILIFRHSVSDVSVCCNLRFYLTSAM